MMIFDVMMCFFLVGVNHSLNQSARALSVGYNAGLQTRSKEVLGLSFFDFSFIILSNFSMFISLFVGDKWQ
jgi:hypothetical protein